MSWSGIKKQCKPLRSQEEAEYASGCMKKRRYESLEAAEYAAAKMAEKHPGKTYNGYVCKFGKHAHVGGIN